MQTVSPEYLKTVLPAEKLGADRRSAPPRSVERKHLIFDEVAEHQVRHFLDLQRVPDRDVGILCPVVAEVVELVLVGGGGILVCLDGQSRPPALAISPPPKSVG
jgi:hypothetical protein